MNNQEFQMQEGEEVLTEQQVQTLQNKCSACGAGMVFDIETGNLKCGHCGNMQELQDNEVVQRRQITNDLINSHEKWTEGKVFACSNCGAKEVLDNKEIARKCSFCGSAKIASIDELPGIKPDSVIPFQITEQTAQARFRKWIKSRWLAPSTFKRSDVKERMNKIYTPCWSFTAMTQNLYRGTLGRTVTIQTRNGTRTSVRWFRVNGQINQAYTDHFIQGGQRISSRSFNGLKPFNLQLIRVYRQEFLSGIIAEHYTKTLEACFNEFSNFVKQDIRRRIIRKHMADQVQHLDIRTSFLERKFNYVLLPIYISNYNYKGKLYNFYINGASGKVVGRYPRSAIRILGIVLGTILIVGGIAAGLWFGGILG